MLKKSMKNIVLALLVLIAFVLVYQIWFNSSFLPNGSDYVLKSLRSNIITPIVRLLEGRSDADFSQNLQELFKPDKIVLHASGDRRVYSNGGEGFSQVRAMAGEIMSRCMLGDYTIKSKETVDTESFYNVLKGKSIYVDYGKNCDYRLFSFGVCGQEKNRFTEDLSVIRGYIIGLHDGIMNDFSLYVKDQKSGNIYRYMLEGNKEEIETSMNEFMMDPANSGSPSYSFELNFHKEQEQMETKVIFEPLLLMDLVPKTLPHIATMDESELEHLLQDGLIDDVLDVFSIDGSTTRKYIDLDNERVFVENNATLTIYPSGLLEYQTVQGGHGLDITGGANQGAYDIYAATSHAVDFVARLCDYMPPDYFEHLQFHTDLTENAQQDGVYRICFDYCIDGTPLQHKTVDGYSHTIEMEIENGYLKSYKQYIKDYEKTEGVWQQEPMLKAADALVDAHYVDKALYIEKIGVCYVENSDATIAPTWAAVVDGHDKMIE